MEVEQILQPEFRSFPNSVIYPTALHSQGLQLTFTKLMEVVVPSMSRTIALNFEAMLHFRN